MFIISSKQEQLKYHGKYVVWLEGYNDYFDNKTNPYSNPDEVIEWNRGNEDAKIDEIEHNEYDD